VVITFNTYLLQALFEILNILFPLTDILLGLIISVDQQLFIHLFLRILILFNINEHFVLPFKFCPFFESYINIYYNYILFIFILSHNRISTSEFGS